MKALYLKDSLALKEIPVPLFNENEALVKVKMAGIDIRISDNHNLP